MQIEVQMFKTFLAVLLAFIGLVIASVGTVSVAYAVVIYSILSWAFVGAKFYAWFVLPVFTNLPSIGFATMAGIYMFVQVFIYKGSGSNKVGKSFWILTLLAPWLWLLLGWFFTVV